jgi:hypothetical protein
MQERSTQSVFKGVLSENAALEGKHLFLRLPVMNLSNILTENQAHYYFLIRIVPLSTLRLRNISLLSASK